MPSKLEQLRTKVANSESITDHQSVASVNPDHRETERADAEEQSTLFNITRRGRLVPRAIFVDSDAYLIEEIRNGIYRGLHHPQNLISHYEDCSGNFARGNITVGKHMIERVMDRIRLAVEHTDRLQGFITTHSSSGGTGSGLTAYILRCLATDYGKYSVIQLPVYPSPQLSKIIVEPYNTVLHLDQAIDAVRLSVLMDNQAIGDVCHHKLLNRQPTYRTMNQVMALLTSSLVSPIRFPRGCMTSGLDELVTNLVPFPRIHFPVLRHSPFMHSSRSLYVPTGIDQLVQSVFTNAGQTVKCDMNRGKYMACLLSFRGLIGPRLVNSALKRLKATPCFDFVDWCPTGVKVNLVAQPPIFLAQDTELAPTDCSVTLLANTTAIRSIWSSVGAKFDILFSRRSFLHWFLAEGLEEGEMTEAREKLACLEADYREVSGTGNPSSLSSHCEKINRKLLRGGWRYENAISSRTDTQGDVTSTACLSMNNGEHDVEASKALSEVSIAED